MLQCFPSEAPSELLDPIIGSTKSLLSAIQRFSPSVTRVVYTSSFAAIVDVGKGKRPGYIYTENDWNPVSIHPSYLEAVRYYNL